MAKIENQSGLTLGTNLFLHIQEVDDTDITINATPDTIVQGAGDFTATSSVSGIEGSGFTAGDTIEVISDDGASDFIATIDTVVALQIDYTFVSGTEADVTSGVRVNIQRVAKYVEYQAAGGLDLVDGVEATALHSKMQTLWKDNDLDKYDPLSGSIEPRGKSLYFLNGWDWFNLASRNAHRGGAVQVQDTKASAARKIYAHITAPDTVDTTDQWYYWYRGDAANTAVTNAVMTGYMDQLVLILDTDNSVDLRGKWIVSCRELTKTMPTQQIELLYAETVGVTVTNSIDPILGTAAGPTTSDATITAGANAWANPDVSRNALVAVARTTVGADGNVAMTETFTDVGASVTGLANGSATEKAYGSIDLNGVIPTDGDTVTIDDGVNTAIVFEFDSNATVTGNNVSVLIGADDAECAVNLSNAINDQTLAGNCLLVSSVGVSTGTIEGTGYQFSNVVDYDSQDYVVVHEKLHYLFRQDEATNINQDVSGPYMQGLKEFPISTFVGPTQTLDGVSLSNNHAASNQNDIDFLDASDTVREWDTIASYTIVVPQTFIDGTPAPQLTIYEAASHGASGATIVSDTTPTVQQDIVLTNAETSISFAHSTFGDTEIAIAYNQPGVAEAEVFFGNTIVANTTQRFQLAPTVDPSYIA